MRVLSTTS